MQPEGDFYGHKEWFLVSGCWFLMGMGEGCVI